MEQSIPFIAEDSDICSYVQQLQDTNAEDFSIKAKPRS